MKRIFAEGQRVFVHRYRWSHEEIRKQMRRMKKDGQARVLQESKDGWLYEVTSASAPPA